MSNSGTALAVFWYFDARNDPHSRLMDGGIPSAVEYVIGDGEVALLLFVYDGGHML